jgi:Domain of Unknown Function (DUF349)
MSEEKNFDLINWWNEQSFAGKELFKLEENGDLILVTNSNIKERTIANVSAENCDVVLKDLQEKFADVDSKVREMEVEWLAAEDKTKLAEKVSNVKEYLHQVIAVGDFQKPALLVHDWEHTLYKLTEEAYAAKVKLVELAETLAQSDNWKEATQALREIADQWKQSGYVDRGRNDKLWNRIEAARKTFQDRKRVHHEEEEKDLLHNLDLKIDLVEQAEAIASSEDWKKTTDTFLRLTEEWKTIGHTVNKKNEELWHRFLAAKSSFFDRKREHSGKIQVEQENNYIVKQALAEKAEALKDSTDWNATAQAFAALMEEWKKTGRVPKEKGDDLWNRFTAAQEQFFDAKKKHFDEIRGVQEQNYELKKEIYERAEQLKHSSHWGDATAEMMELLEEWKKIGPIPRSYGDKMWEDFNAARKFFFARKDANREQRKQYAEKEKVARVAHAKDTVVKLEDEIKEEEEKLIDFKNGLENITPGKKAAELRAHLEQLIAEGEVKIKRLKDKFAQAQEDLKSVPVEKPAETANAEGGVE